MLKEAFKNSVIFVKSTSRSSVLSDAYFTKHFYLRQFTCSSIKFEILLAVVTARCNSVFPLADCFSGGNVIL